MTFSDLSEFCRLCLLPLSGTHIDCALDDKIELRDTIKMVYSIDIQPEDEYSTKVCLMCCDFLLLNTIHYVRAVTVQKGLTRIQRIKTMLRNFGKKKTNKKGKKTLPSVSPERSTSSSPLPEAEIINDIEMVEIDPNCSRVVSLDDCEMQETYDHHEAIVSHIEPHHQLLFGNLNSFAPIQQQQQQQQWPQPKWPTINDDANIGAQKWLGEIFADNGSMNDVLIVPPPKPDIDHNNNKWSWQQIGFFNSTNGEKTSR